MRPLSSKRLACAIALEPDNVQLGNNLGAVLMRLHRHAEAREILHLVP